MIAGKANIVEKVQPTIVIVKKTVLKYISWVLVITAE